MEASGMSAKEAELVQSIDRANGAAGDIERDFAEHCRREITRMTWDVAMDLRAGSDTTCDRCGGPIAKGDRIITTPSKARPGAVMHRSCLYASDEQIHHTRLANRRKQPEPEPADPRQVGLFGDGAAGRSF
jgi:hypothetical protein